MTPKDKAPSQGRGNVKGGTAPRKKPDEHRPAPAAAAAVDPSGERISKRLARAGVASRRDVERMILEGRVSLNGQILTTPAVTVGPHDRIEVDGAEVGAIERTRLWLYYKPAGLVTTNRDPEGRTTIFDRLPADLPRTVTIGRLDINTEGLLLLTNDGGLARVLELPTTGWLRRYRVRAHGRIDQAKLDELKGGIAVDGVLYGAIDAVLEREQGSNVWITMGLREGKNREIKNVLGALGLEVNRLIRISYGPFQLAEMAEGEVREVRGRTLRDQLGPRLIEEAGANFEAPMEVRQKPEAPAEKPEKGKVHRSHEKPAERNERMRGRLDTRKGEAGDKPDAKRKPSPLQRRRASNVWLAPGARPMGPKKAEAKAEAEARQAAKDERQRKARAEYGGKPGGPKPGDAKPFGKPGERDAGGAKPFGRPGGSKTADTKPSGKPGAGKSSWKSGGKPGEKGSAGPDRNRKEQGRPGGGKPFKGRGDADRRR